MQNCVAPLRLLVTCGPAVLLLALAAPPGDADTLVTQSGSTWTGTVTEQGEFYVLTRADGSTISFPRSSVARVTRSDSSDASKAQMSPPGGATDPETALAKALEIECRATFRSNSEGTAESIPTATISVKARASETIQYVAVTKTSDPNGFVRLERCAFASPLKSYRYTAHFDPPLQKLTGTHPVGEPEIALVRTVLRQYVLSISTSAHRYTFRLRAAEAQKSGRATDASNADAPFRVEAYAVARKPTVKPEEIVKEAERRINRVIPGVLKELENRADATFERYDSYKPDPNCPLCHGRGGIESTVPVFRDPGRVVYGTTLHACPKCGARKEAIWEEWRQINTELEAMRKRCDGQRGIALSTISQCKEAIAGSHADGQDGDGE